MDAAGSAAKREGYGSARATKDEWEVRYTPAGERAAAIWPALPDEIETRWRERFGATHVDELVRALRAVDEAIDMGMPDFLPVVGSPNGMALELPSVDDRREPEDLALVVLLAHALMAYTLEFEESAALALPLSANVVRVLDGEGTPVRELPALAGISKEAVAVSLTALKKTRLRRRGRRARIQADDSPDLRGRGSPSGRSSPPRAYRGAVEDSLRRGPCSVGFARRSIASWTTRPSPPD